MSRYRAAIDAEDVYQMRLAQLDLSEKQARAIYARLIEQAQGDQAAIFSANEKLKRDLERFERCRAKMKETEF